MSTGIRSLDRSINNTVSWLKDVQEELKWPDEERVYKATRAVLLAVRDRLPLDEASELAAQLPMIMRGFYYEAYDPSDKPLKIRDRDEFLELVRQNFGADPLDAEEAVNAVLTMFYKRMPGGELEDVKNSMPEDIKGFFVAAEKSQQE